MTMTAEQQSEIARLALELRIAQDGDLLRRTSRITAMLYSLYRALKDEGDGVKGSCIGEIMVHLSDLDTRLRELLPIDNKVVTPMSRRAG